MYVLSNELFVLKYDAISIICGAVTGNIELAYLTLSNRCKR